MAHSAGLSAVTRTKGVPGRAEFAAVAQPGAVSQSDWSPVLAKVVVVWWLSPLADFYSCTKTL